MSQAKSNNNKTVELKLRNIVDKNTPKTITINKKKVLHK